MKIDSFIKYQIGNILKFGIFSFIIFLIMIQFIIGKDFGVVRALFSFFYGISLGILFEFTNNTRFYSLSFLLRNFIRLTYILASFFLIIFVLKYFFSFFIITNSNLNISLTKDFFNTVVGVLIVTILIVLFIELEKHLGDYFIWNFLFSKYKKPFEEERVVMFLDLKDSTSITETIGSDKFVELINLCYRIMSKPILKNKATILKYVGDEVILTWPIKKGIKNNNCVNFYFDFNDELEKHRNEFITKFKIFPVFKAGLHSGIVTAAFLGSIKKQMDYSGDVMNTTARIESICNQYGANFLISESIANKLQKSDNFFFKDLGEAHLKGKVNKTRIKEVLKLDLLS